MIPAIRQETILKELLEHREVVYIADLQNILKVSTSTLRRDLRELEMLGKVRLLHGGGIQLASNSTKELGITLKLSLNKQLKSKIAEKASEFVTDGDVIFLDPSSTTFEMIPFLANKKIKVITNGILHINALASNHIPCIMVGGDIKEATNSCLGPIAENILTTFNFSKCFLGSNGFSINAGITNHDTSECNIKQLAIKQSIDTFFLLDSSKFGITTMVKVADINSHTIITDKRIHELKTFKNILVCD